MRYLNRKFFFQVLLLNIPNGLSLFSLGAKATRKPEKLDGLSIALASRNEDLH